VQLKGFLADGGTLIVDAAGGAEPFASALESQLGSLIAGEGFQTLPATHPALTGGGDEAVPVAYRPYAQKLVAGRANVPRIKALKIGNRPAVLFSREDLSVGLVGTRSVACSATSQQQRLA
jgi:hypothetical protein